MAIVRDLSANAAAALPRPSLRDDILAWGVAASLAFHVLVLTGALNWRAPSVPAPEPVLSIPVELLSSEQYQTETGGNPAVGNMVRARLPPASTPELPAGGETEPGGMIRPAAMLSAAVLADPKNRQARDKLRTYDPTERTVQLCDVEAAEQVHAWQASFRPELVVPYAMAELAISGDTIRAEGAAFFSGGAWYAMRFDCGLSADHAIVVSFAFRVGEAIPRDRWEAHNLPLANSADD